MKNKRANATPGASQKVTSEITGRLREIRALWFGVHNDPKHSISDLAEEFYFKVGELLEGKTLKQLTYHGIDKERVLEHVEDS
jgi:hypothetical protein